MAGRPGASARTRSRTSRPRRECPQETPPPAGMGHRGDYGRQRISDARGATAGPPHSVWRSAQSHTRADRSLATTGDRRKIGPPGRAGPQARVRWQSTLCIGARVRRKRGVVCSGRPVSPAPSNPSGSTPCSRADRPDPGPRPLGPVRRGPGLRRSEHPEQHAHVASHARLPYPTRCGAVRMVRGTALGGCSAAQEHARRVCERGS